MKKNDKKRLEHDAEASGTGALIGAAMGAIGGPPGVVVGAILGGIAGGVTAEAVQEESKGDEENDKKLDEEIGVTSAEIGAPNLKHPPAVVGAYSGASSGAGGSDDRASADGPLQPPPDE